MRVSQNRLSDRQDLPVSESKASDTRVSDTVPPSRIDDLDRKFAGGCRAVGRQLREIYGRIARSPEARLWRPR